MERRLRLSSLGNADTRRAYGEELRAHLRARESELSDEVRARIDANPLRAFDSDHEGTRAVMADAPLLIDRLDPDDAEHFAEVRALLDEAGQAYELDPTLVRGLDYYTRTVFEFESPSLGAQSGVGGGGRYDGLVEQLGGPADARRGLGRRRRADPAGGRPRGAGAEDARVRGRGRPGARDARRSRWRGHCGTRGCPPQVEQAGRSLKGQLKQADRLGARAVVIVGDTIEVKDMESGEQREVSGADEVLALLSATASSDEPDLRQPLPQRLGRLGARRPRGRGGARGRLGAPPPRPRRADLHRPARPRGAAAAGVPPRGRGTTPTATPHALRAEDVISATGQAGRAARRAR